MSEKRDGIVNDKSAEKNGKVDVFIAVISFLIGLLMYPTGHSIIAFILFCISAIAISKANSILQVAYAGNVHLQKKAKLIIRIIIVCFVILGGFIIVSF